MTRCRCHRCALLSTRRPRAPAPRRAASRSQHIARSLARTPGYTLVEVLTTVAVLAVLAGLAIPNLAPVIERIAFRRAADELFESITFARNSAMARGETVLVVPDEPARRDYAAGWTVFVDRDGDARATGADTILQRHPALPQRVRVQSAFTQQGPAYVAYNGGGRSCTAASSTAARWGSITLARDGEARRIRIAMLGRARLCDPQRDTSCGKPVND
ncbi:GspH/FimT family pseudopilin [Zemynaea arenosa]|nr:GspH/FimT family pseudopilin [Massilia arenosa]